MKNINENCLSCYMNIPLQKNLLKPLLISIVDEEFAQFGIVGPVPKSM